MFAGYLDVLDGRTDTGLARVRTVRAQLVGGPAPAPGVPGLATRLLLEGYALAGRPEAGLALAGEALGLGRGAELWEAEIRRLRATFLAAGGAPAGEVTAELERALAVARRQQARVFEQFEFRLYPLGPIVLAGLAMFPIDRAAEVMRRWRDWADGAPDELSTGCAVILAPPEEFVPPELRGQPVLGIPVLYVGDPEAGAAVVQPLKDLGPGVDHIGPMPYTAFQAALDPLAPWDIGGGFYARGEYMSGLGDAAIEVFLTHAAGLVTLSPPFSQMVIFRIGQGVAAVPDEATAFSHRDASYLFHPITAWLDPADGEKMIAATRAFAVAMRPYGTGASYLNFTHEADRVRDAYGDAKYARLVALKNTYDPANLFRLNQNIRPSQLAVEPVLA